MPDLATLVVAAIVAVAVVLTFRGFYQRVQLFEYEAGLLYRNGRFEKVIGPGRHWIYAPTTTIRRVDTRTAVVTVPGQELVTSDGISVKISLVLQYRVVDLPLAVHGVSDYLFATYALAQVAVREVIGALSIDDVLQRRSELGTEVRNQSEEAIRKLGVELVAVDVKDLMLSAATKRTLGQVVDARQKGLAALEKARGETAALRSLGNAARMVEASPALLQLRLLQQLESTSGNTVLLGMPPNATPLPVREVGPGSESPAPADRPPERDA